MATRRALEFEGQPIPPTHHLLRPKFLIGTAALLALLGTYALSRGGETHTPPINNAPMSDSYKPPEPLQKPEIQVIIPPPPEQQPTPPDSKTAPVTEKVEAAHCLITLPELCTQAERIRIIRSNGVTETYVVLNPDQKTAFFVPEDGRLLDKIEESGDPFSGISATVYKPYPPGGAYIFVGLEVNNMLQVKDPKKGSLIGHSNITGTTNFGAKVLVTVTKRTPNGPVTDEDALRELLPTAFAKPIKATYSQETLGIPNVSMSYSSNPPQ